MLLDYESPLERQQKEESEAAAKAERQRKAQAEAQRKAQEEQEAAQLLAQQRLELATRDAQTKMKQLAINNAANLVPAILASLGDGELRRTLARQMLEKLNRKTVQAKASENKEWAKNLLLSAGLGE
jgi:membrane protein involved in colicin uptake